MPSLMIKLKQGIWPLHQQLEQSLDLLNPRFSVADYRRLIAAFWGYYRPLEAQLQAHQALREGLPDLAQRAKLPLLEADLLALGHAEAPPRLPVCGDLPVCNTLDQAFGCLYVMEGATLGGQVLCRHFNQSLGLDARNGSAFFVGYGEATGAMWALFGERLTAANVDETAAISAAGQTFQTLGQWLRPIILFSGDT